MSDLVDAVCGQTGAGPLHERLARAWRVDGAKIDAIRRALVLTADHELNASTFAARGHRFHRGGRWPPALLRDWRRFRARCTGA